MLSASAPTGVPRSLDDPSVPSVPPSASFPPPTLASVALLEALEHAVNASTAKRRGAARFIEDSYLSKPVFGGYGRALRLRVGGAHTKALIARASCTILILLAGCTKGSSDKCFVGDP